MEDQIKSITKKLYIPPAVDNIFNSNFLLKKLREGQKSFDGGTNISIPIEYDEIAAGASFAGLEILDTSVGSIITLAEYDWRHYHVPISWSRGDYLKNNGSKTRIVNMVEALTKNAGRTMQKNLTTGIFQASKAATTDIDGLIVAIVAAGTTDCGGLDSNDFSTWAPQRDTTTTALSLAAMNKQWNSATSGTDKPTLVVTTNANYGYYFDIATPLQRYMNNDTASQGFTSLSFNGVPVVPDEDCNANHVYILNLNHLFLAVHSMEDMRYQEPQVPLNQAANVGHIFWYGNIVTDARRRQAVMTAVTS